MQSRLERTASIRAVDDTGNYYDVDHFVEYLSAAAADGDADRRDAGAGANPKAVRSVRVNRQAAKQLDDSTYEVIATGLRLHRVSRPLPAAAAPNPRFAA